MQPPPLQVEEVQEEEEQKVQIVEHERIGGREAQEVEAEQVEKPHAVHRRQRGGIQKEEVEEEAQKKESISELLLISLLFPLFWFCSFVYLIYY